MIKDCLKCLIIELLFEMWYNKVVMTTALEVTVPSYPYCFAMIKQEGVVDPASIIKIAMSFSVRKPMRTAIVVKTTGRIMILITDATTESFSLLNAFFRLNSAPMQIKASGVARRAI